MSPSSKNQFITFGVNSQHRQGKASPPRQPALKRKAYPTLNERSFSQARPAAVDRADAKPRLKELALAKLHPLVQPSLQPPPLKRVAPRAITAATKAALKELRLNNAPPLPITKARCKTSKVSPVVKHSVRVGKENTVKTAAPARRSPAKKTHHTRSKSSMTISRGRKSTSPSVKTPRCKKMGQSERKDSPRTASKDVKVAKRKRSETMNVAETGDLTSEGLLQGTPLRSVCNKGVEDSSLSSLAMSCEANREPFKASRISETVSENIAQLVHGQENEGMVVLNELESGTTAETAVANTLALSSNNPGNRKSLIEPRIRAFGTDLSNKLKTGWSRRQSWAGFEATFGYKATSTSTSKVDFRKSWKKRVVVEETSFLSADASMSDFYDTPCKQTPTTSG